MTEYVILLLLVGVAVLLSVRLLGASVKEQYCRASSSVGSMGLATGGCESLPQDLVDAPQENEPSATPTPGLCSCQGAFQEPGSCASAGDGMSKASSVCSSSLCGGGACGVGKLTKADTDDVCEFTFLCVEK